MGLRKILEKVDQLIYRSYDKLEVQASKRRLISKNAVNDIQLQEEFILLEGKISLINRGSIKGIIIARDASIYNYGVFDGVIFCKNGTIHLKGESKLVGLAHSHAISLQPGCIINGEWIGRDEAKFNEKVSHYLKEKELQEIARIMASW